jgi:YVTN family beta-propeller protein
MKRVNLLLVLLLAILSASISYSDTFEYNKKTDIERIGQKKYVYAVFSERSNIFDPNKIAINYNPIVYLAMGGELPIWSLTKPRDYNEKETPVHVKPDTLMLFDTQDPGASCFIMLKHKTFNISYNPLYENLYLAQNDNTIRIIDTTKPNFWLGQLNLQGNATDLKLSKDNKILLAGVLGNKYSIAVINCAEKRFINSIYSDEPVNAVGISRDNKIIFGASGSFSNGYVTAYDDQGKKISEIKVENNPICIETSPVTNEIYVANKNSGSVSVIDCNRLVVVKTIRLGAIEPFAMVFSPDGSRLYITLYGSNSVAVIDTKEKEVIQKINVGKNPTGISVSLDGKYLFVANKETSNISQIDVEKGYAVICNTTPLPQSYAWGVAATN